MKVFSLPSDVRALLFDIDNTLYSNDGYYRLQGELLLERYADAKRMSVETARELLEAEKRHYASQNNGKKTSIGNIMRAMGVSLKENALWRTELFKPAEHLAADGDTIGVIKELTSEYTVAAVTNNPVEIGRRTLAALGLDGLVPLVIGLDTCFVSKPAKEPFETALRTLDVSPCHAVSIGDRYEVDLEIPLSMGMGAILVEELSDLYQIPNVLRQG